MYHIELRQFPHNHSRFNLDERQMRALVEPWAAEKAVELGERKWSPHQAKLTVLEGPQLDVSELKMGRGWRAAQRQSSDVTERVMGEALLVAEAAREAELAAVLARRAAGGAGGAGGAADAGGGEVGGEGGSEAGGGALRAAENALQDGGGALQAGGSALQDRGGALQAGGSALQGGGGALQAGGSASQGSGAAAQDGGGEMNDPLALGMQMALLLGSDATRLLGAWREVAGRSSGLAPSESLALAERQVAEESSRAQS